MWKGVQQNSKERIELGNSQDTKLKYNYKKILAEQRPLFWRKEDPSTTGCRSQEYRIKETENEPENQKGYTRDQE